jgi:hypothetical protein
MALTPIDHLEAALARLTREDIAALPPARRQRLRATLGAWECLCCELVQPRWPNGILADLQQKPRDE